MYLHTSTHSAHADMICHQHAPLRCCRPSENGSAIIVILCALYCTVFSPVTWINLTALHSTLHQRWLSLCRWLVSGLPVCVHVFWRSVALESDYAGRVGSCAFKAILISLASPKSPTLPLSCDDWHGEINTATFWLLRLQTWLATIVGAVVDQSNVGNHRCTVLSSWTY